MQRYKHIVDSHANCYCNMEHDEKGRFVLYSDAYLRIAELEAECDRRGKLLKETIDVEVAQVDEIKRLRSELQSIADSDYLDPDAAYYLVYSAKAAMEGDKNE